MLAKAVANESDATFIKMAGSELVRKFIGEGARLVRDLFELAGEREPAVIFIDEIDAVAAKRTDSKTSGDAEVQRTMMQLLSRWTALTTAARSGSWPPRTASTCSTRRSCVRGALTASSRCRSRTPRVARILEIHTQDMNVAEGTDVSEVAADLEGYSGADIASLATEAGMFAIRDGRTEVTQADFEQARARSCRTPRRPKSRSSTTSTRRSDRRAVLSSAGFHGRSTGYASKHQPRGARHHPFIFSFCAVVGSAPVRNPLPPAPSTLSR